MEAGIVNRLGHTLALHQFSTHSLCAVRHRVFLWRHAGECLKNPMEVVATYPGFFCQLIQRWLFVSCLDQATHPGHGSFVNRSFARTFRPATLEQRSRDSGKPLGQLDDL